MRSRARRANLIFLVIIVAVGGFLYLRQRSKPPRPVVVAREVSGTRGVAPAPEFLLKHAAELNLTAAQRARVEAVARAYRRDIAPTQEKLERATEQYQQYLRSAKARRSAEELAAHGSEVQRLSAVVASTRRAYWEQAEGALTPAQRSIAETLARRGTVRDLT